MNKEPPDDVPHKEEEGVSSWSAEIFSIDSDLRKENNNNDLNNNYLFFLNL